LRGVRDFFSQTNREKDALIKAYRRMEIMLGNARDWIPSLKDRNEKRRCELDGFKRERGSLKSSFWFIGIKKQAK
jgi:hypothetical protein